MPWLCSVCKRPISQLAADQLDGNACPDHHHGGATWVTTAPESKPQPTLSELATNFSILAKLNRERKWYDVAQAYENCAAEIRTWIADEKAREIAENPAVDSDRPVGVARIAY